MQFYSELEEVLSQPPVTQELQEGDQVNLEVETDPVVEDLDYSFTEFEPGSEESGSEYFPTPKKPKKRDHRLRY